VTLGQEVSIIYAAVNGHMNDVEVPKVRAFEEAFQVHGVGQADVLKAIDDPR
jgi:hypothetical protein